MHGKQKMLIGAVVVAMSAAAVAVGAPFDGPDREVRSAPTPLDRGAAQRERAAKIPADEPGPVFAVLRRAREAGDAVPAKWQPRSAVGEVRAEDSRLALSSALSKVYAIPTDREICVVSTYAKAGDGGASESCAPTAEAASRGVVLVLQCIDGVHPSPQFVSGLIGDGVSAVRATHAGKEVGRAPVRSNAFQLTLDEAADTLEYVGTGAKVPLASPIC